jgi:hypothetical protein
MKNGNTYYIELTRHLFNSDPYKSMSVYAKWLYVVLKENEHKFTGSQKSKNPQDFFTRSDKELVEDSGLCLGTLKKAKAELLQTDLLQTWKGHITYTNSGKKSENPITHYRILT